MTEVSHHLSEHVKPEDEKVNKVDASCYNDVSASILSLSEMSLLSKERFNQIVQAVLRKCQSCFICKVYIRGV